VALSADGSLAASAGYDKMVIAWDPRSGIVRHRLLGHPDVIWAVAFSQSGRLLVSGGQDYTGSRDYCLRLWDATTGRQVRELQGHRATISSLLFATDEQIVSGSWDETIRVWQVGDGKSVQEFSVGVPVVCLSLSPEGQRILFGSTSGNLPDWNQPLAGY
jgi:WD40 repeat protein